MLSKLKTFFELIKFEHTVFALPFAYMGMMLARRVWPPFGVFFWVTLAMVGARTAGMALNRVIDVKIDARNPRTSHRATVTGEIPVPNALAFAAASILIFFIAAWQLNPLCLRFSPFALVLLCTYHYVKRFSFLCHFVLGLVLAIAPVGGWLAVTGVFSWLPVVLAAAVLFWTAGFDILYSLQDIDFDKTYGLHSVPVAFGQKAALQVSVYCHVATVVFLAIFGLWDGLGILYWIGAGLVAGLLWFEHSLVADGDLSKVNTAFFTVNGWVGILLLIFTFLEIFR